jgi:hypothetical protein
LSSTALEVEERILVNQTLLSPMITTMKTPTKFATIFVVALLTMVNNRDFTHVRRQRQDDGYQYNIINPYILG